MEDILKSIQRQYFLQFGKYSISPLSAISAGLILEYIDDFHKMNYGLHPFAISFPNKKDAYIPLCTAVLINFFFRDYVYHDSEYAKSLKFSIGDKIEVFNSVALIDRINDDILVLKFAEEVQYTVRKADVKYISKTTKTKLGKYKSFRNNKKIFFSNRNAISQILEANSADLINPSVFSSQILLITGRGNFGRIKAGFEATKLYEEPLSKILGAGSNLIIQKDLELYKNLFDRNIDDTIDRYRLMLQYQKKNRKTGCCSVLKNLARTGNLNTAI